MRDYFMLSKTTIPNNDNPMYKGDEIVYLEGSDYGEFSKWYDKFLKLGYTGEIKRKRHWWKGHIYYKILMKR
jgi:hypothetical protein